MTSTTVQEFHCLEEWLTWSQTNPWVYDKNYIANLAENIRRNGLIDPILGFIAPSEVQIEGTNLRETIVARAANSRIRADLLLLAEIGITRGWMLDGYMPEFLTPFAERMKSHFPKMIGSEYVPDAQALAKLKKSFPGLMHQDVQALTFSDKSFDIHISNEVMEHVPSIPQTLAEAFRTLRDSGLLISTFPFMYTRKDSYQKARLDGNKIEYLEEPEYHGNPTDPQKGSLVFTVPGWDILDTCRAIGFSEAKIVFISSLTHGVTGADCAGIFVLVARR